MDNKIVLIDGNSIFYRQYFAMPASMKSRSGLPTNAIFGFAGVIVKVIKDLNPTHIAVAFDVSKHTFRNDLYSEYKAGRKPMPDDLRTQLMPLKEMLSLMNICVLEKEGLEGDDILGTIAKRFNKNTIIVTGDRDAYQLVDDSTKIYLTKKGLSEIKILDERAIIEEFGLKPQQMVELKALQGDKSDNIPGAPGVGEKTALMLMQKYGSIDEIYNHIDEIKGKLGENIKNNRELVELSKKLAKINTSVDIACTLDDMKYDFPFSSAVKDFFIECDFNSLLKKDELFSLNSETHSSAPKMEHKAILSEKDVDDFIEKVKITKELAVHYDEYGFYMSEGREEYKIKYDSTLINFDGIVKKLLPLFSSDEILKILFDSKSFMHVLDRFGSKLNNFFDVSIARHLVSGTSVTSIDEIFSVLDFDSSAPSLSLARARLVLEESIKEFGMEKLYYDMELPLAGVLFEMERAGFKLDHSFMNKLDKQYKIELDELTGKIYKMVGREFNIKSPKQLSEIIYDELHLKKSRKKSTNIEALEEIADRHPLIPLIIRYRKVQKFLSTYIDGLKPHIDANGFIHTTFKQTITTTGRLSSTEPNLQNIPIRTEESREIRSMFVASSEDRVLIDADYSQIELRILAHMSNDEKLIRAFNNGEDIHSQTASYIFNVPQNLVTPEMRRVAKVVNFGVVYGISDFGLSSDLKIPVVEARAFIDTFFTEHPNIKLFMEQQIKNARETGRVVTLFGRTRKMLDINSTNYLLRQRAERASQNMPIQGSAADIIKIAMININRALKREFSDAKLIMQIHDELIIDTPKDMASKVQALIDREMENVIKLSVPLIADSTISYRWSDGH